MPTNTFKKGDTLYSQDTGESLGIVNYDTQTGAKLRKGQTTDIISNPPTNIIPSDTLSNSTQRLKLPPASTDTTGAGLSSYVENMASASQTASDKTITEKDTSGLDYLKALTDSENIPSSIDYTAQDKAKKISDKLNAQIMADAKATRDRIEQVKQTFGGTTAGAQQEIGRIQNESSNHQADLAILKFVADNDYQGAADIADRQLKNKLEASRIKLEGLKFIYTENKEMFNKAEDRAYQEKIKNDERAYDEKVKFETDLNNLKLKAAEHKVDATTLQKMGEAKTISEAIDIGRNWMSDAIKTDANVPTIKTINGVDMQWDGTKWITPTGAGGGGVISPYQDERMTRNLQAVANLKSRVNFQTIGVFNALGGWTPGSIQRDFNSDVKTLIANITFGELTAMREASKTGGALGQVSDRENQLLGATLGSLDTWQSPSQFSDNLQKIEDSILRWKNAVHQYGSGQIIISPTGEQIIITD